MNSTAIKTGVLGLLLVLAQQALADNADTPPTKTYAMNVYTLLCKNWKQGKPLQVVEVINKKKGTEAYYLEDQQEGGGALSSGLDAIAQGPFDDDELDKNITALLKKHSPRQYATIDAARQASCADVRAGVPPSQAKAAHPAPAPKASDMATTICTGNKARIVAALQYRKGGLPISYAERSIDKMRSNDVRLIEFLYGSVQVAYERPEEMEASLNNGKWVEGCAKYIRGY